MIIRSDPCRLRVDLEVYSEDVYDTIRSWNLPLLQTYNRLIDEGYEYVFSESLGFSESLDRHN